MAARPDGPPAPGLVAPLLLAAMLLGPAAAPARASAYHTEPLNGLIARCSTIVATQLPEQSLARYEVEADRNRGLLSCVVQPRDGDAVPDNVEAELRASYRPIGQAPQPLDIRQVREGNLVTYLGTYRISGSEPIQFDVRIEVEGRAERRFRFTDRTPAA